METLASYDHLAGLITGAMSAFGVKGELEVKSLTNGYANRVFKVRQISKDRSYSVHIPGHFNEDAIKNEICITQQLEDSSLRVASVLVSENGDPFYQAEGIYVTASHWLDGQHPPENQISDPTCEMLGRSLAIFHVSIKNLPHKNEYHLLHKGVKEWWQEHSALHADIRVQELWAIAKHLENDALPQGIVHGDFHANNVLIGREKVAVLDMEHVGHGVWVFDIARAATDLCSTQEGFSHQKSHAFLRGYQEVRPLQKNELAAYKPALCYAALAVAGWFYGNKMPEMADRFLNTGTSAIKILK